MINGRVESRSCGLLALVLFGLMAACTGPAVKGGDVAPAAREEDPTNRTPAVDDDEGTVETDNILIDSHMRLGVANHVHMVGRSGTNLVHRVSEDNGETWSSGTTIEDVYPVLYGAMAVVDSTVYLLTVTRDPGSAPGKDVSFRKSTDNGETWSSAVQINTADEDRVHRVYIAVSGDFVHVVGLRAIEDEGSDEAWYFRSANGGDSWDTPVQLDSDGGQGGIDVAVEGSTVHIAYAKMIDGDWRTHYVRSKENGANFPTPVLIGGEPAGDHETRTRIRAADGRVVVAWSADQGVDPGQGGAIHGVRSSDGGDTWTAIETFADTAQSHHHDMDMVGSVVHLAWGADHEKASPAQYRVSTDYGDTWGPIEDAITEPGAIMQAFNLRAGDAWVHFVAGEAGSETNVFYARRSSETQWDWQVLETRP